MEAGALEVSFIRRTRIDGDAWEASDVPLVEESEHYVVRLRKDDAIIRTQFVDTPFWIYPLSEQAADGLTGGFDVEVAQLSATYGEGPAGRASYVA